MGSQETAFPDFPILIEAKGVSPMRLILAIRVVVTYVMTIIVKLRIK